jgi:hypothetical protein
MQMDFRFDGESTRYRGRPSNFYATLGALWNIQREFAKKPTNNISDKSTVSSKQIKVFLKKQQKTYGINPK